jgi:hypothetical protein
MKAASLILLALSLSTSARAADRLYSPVMIKQPTIACPNIASLKLRDGLAQQDRTETLDGVNSLGGLVEKCGTAPEGQWMFFEQASGAYVCLRPRLGADCSWVHRASVSEIVELGSNQKPNCQALAATVEKSRKYQAELSKEYTSSQPKNMGESFVRGFLGDVVGMVGVNGRQVVVNADKKLSCHHDFVTAQETARRLVAYRACPSLGNAEQERANYNATMRWANERCSPQ